MTTNITITPPERDLEAMLRERYRVEPIWYQRAGLSWEHAVRQRLCSEANLGSEQAEARRPVREAGKGVRFQRQAGKDYQADPVAAIQDMCADSPEYRDASLPVKEIIFRLLLANGNEPMTVLELYDAVLEWVRGGDGRVITPEVVQRLLSNDQDYGFMQAAD